MPDSRTGPLRSQYFPEPPLEFAGSALQLDPKAGLSAYGPASLGTSVHPSLVRIGFVGSGESTASAVRWFERTRSGVGGDPSLGLPDFPGFDSDRGFFTEPRYADGTQAKLTTHEMASVLKHRLKRDRFASAVELVSEKVKLLAQQDQRPDVIVLALPDEFIATLKTVRYYDSKTGVEVYRNLRRALKAEVMRFGIPTQILLQKVAEAEPDTRGVDHLSRVAWNLYTGLFYKAGGVPWRPTGLRPDTCYVGLSFHRPAGSATTLRASVAQAFDDSGVGLILRGPDFHWNSAKDGPSPHLDAQQSLGLVQRVLTRYRLETGRTPARVVIHKTSKYWEEERDGFVSALRGIAEFDLVAVRPTSEVRLLRAGQYPPLRGTMFSVSDTHYVYTTGYIASLDSYPHGHVPAPLVVSDHYGDAALEDIIAEILVLTKMNWNSAGFAGALPITIRFSRRVGDIMREVPADRDPMPQFKFYT